MLQSLKTKKSPLISFPTAGKVKGLTPPEVTTPPTLVLPEMETDLEFKYINNGLCTVSKCRKHFGGKMA